MGMDWWSNDPFFTTAADREQVPPDRDAELESLRARVHELESRADDVERAESR
jgi:hypothetical protein